MRPLPEFLAAGIPGNVVTPVAVPTLTWGITGVNVESITGPCDAQLIDVSDPNSPRVLDTLTLPQAFPANTPMTTKNNYPGRPGAFPASSTLFTFDHDNDPDAGRSARSTRLLRPEPGSNPALDPMALMIKVDAQNRVAEGSRENDNELRF